jgi:hypothetical protein
MHVSNATVLTERERRIRNTNQGYTARKNWPALWRRALTPAEA